MGDRGGGVVFHIESECENPDGCGECLEKRERRAEMRCLLCGECEVSGDKLVCEECFEEFMEEWENGRDRVVKRMVKH
jgi:hypothetical protein